jgi:hypothetical protein
MRRASARARSLNASWSRRSASAPARLGFQTLHLKLQGICLGAEFFAAWRSDSNFPKTSSNATLSFLTWPRADSITSEESPQLFRNREGVAFSGTPEAAGKWGEEWKGQTRSLRFRRRRYSRQRADLAVMGGRADLCFLFRRYSKMATARAALLGIGAGAQFRRKGRGFFRLLLGDDPDVPKMGGKVERLCSMLCSSPISAKMFSKTAQTLLPPPG